MCVETPSIKDILLDPNGPHELLMPPCGGFRMRNPTLFLDEPMRNKTAGLSDWMFEASGSDDVHAKAIRLAKAVEPECGSRY
jgi:hypothetical protein